MTFERFASAAPLLVFAAIASGCGPKNSDAFYDKVYLCDSQTPDFDCGTSRSGAPLKCTSVVATNLGGKDFCAEQCIEGANVLTAEYACLQDQSKVARCRPSAGAAACASGTRCFRTDLEADDGLCLPLNTCNSSQDCQDGMSPTCATDLIAAQYPNARSALKLDSLNCMAVGCFANQSSCPSGEQCILKVVGPMNGVPDVCLPSCGGNGLCPPNYSCLTNQSAAYPHICVPGLLGKPCDSDLDCMIGQCLDVGYGFHVCSRGCATDADCIPFDDGETYFFCANDWCVSPESLTWPSCVTDADCKDPGLVCARPHADDQAGACRIPCADDGSCPSRAGIIHGCHPWSGQNVCQPGLPGRYECTQDSDCAPGLSCLPVDGADPPRRLCTISCATDGDCMANRQTTTAYCGSLGVCLQPEAAGIPCDHDRVCSSGHCDLTTKTCLASS